MECFTSIQPAKSELLIAQPLGGHNSHVTELFKEIAQKIGDRPGGYTRIIKTGNRLGDNAEMCFIELVDYNENMAKEKVAKKATRTRRSKKSAAPAAVEAPATEEPKAESAE